MIPTRRKIYDLFDGDLELAPDAMGIKSVSHLDIWVRYSGHPHGPPRSYSHPVSMRGLGRLHFSDEEIVHGIYGLALRGWLHSWKYSWNPRWVFKLSLTELKYAKAPPTKRSRHFEVCLEEKLAEELKEAEEILPSTYTAKCLAMLEAYDDHKGCQRDIVSLEDEIARIKKWDTIFRERFDENRALLAMWPESSDSQPASILEEMIEESEGHTARLKEKWVEVECPECHGTGQVLNFMQHQPCPRGCKTP